MDDCSVLECKHNENGKCVCEKKQIDITGKCVTCVIDFDCLKNLYRIYEVDKDGLDNYV